jgi:hypothetical protein
MGWQSDFNSGAKDLKYLPTTPELWSDLRAEVTLVWKNRMLGHLGCTHASLQ